MPMKSFNFSDVLGYGWRVMKKNLWFFVAVGFIWVIISYIPPIIQMMLKYMKLQEIIYFVIYIITTILGWIITIILKIGLTKIALSFCDERKSNITVLFDGLNGFWRYVATGILYALIILIGYILLILPGIILTIKFGLCFYFVVDKGLGPINALKASSRATMGAKTQLFCFSIICVLLNFLGVMCFIIGIFATYPSVLVARALVYKQLLWQTPELSGLGVAVSSIHSNIESPPNEQNF